MAYWATITDTKTAKDAAMQAVGASIFVAAVTGLVAITSIVLKHPVLGVDAYGLVDAGLFGVVAWRTYRMSRAWAVVGLLLYVVEMIWRIKSGVGSVGSLVVAFFIVAAFSNGVRGVFGFHRFGQMNVKVAEPLQP